MRELKKPLGWEDFAYAGTEGWRAGRPGSVPSIDRIDMLLLGRVFAGSAGKSRPIGDCGGWSRCEGAGPYCGEDGVRAWRPL